MTKFIYLSAAALIVGFGAAPAARALPLDNGLSFNGLSFNGLSFNGRNLNGLSFNGSEREGTSDDTAGRATTIILKSGEQITLQ